jgi:hypothetical protein
MGVKDDKLCFYVAATGADGYASFPATAAAVATSPT